MSENISEKQSRAGHDICPGFIAAWPAGAIVGLPAMGLSNESFKHPSTPGHIDPIREISVAGIPHFYDHIGNSLDGFGIAATVVATGLAIHMVRGTKEPNPVALGALAAGTSTTVNVAYEAHLFGNAPGHAFDSGDAACGAITGTLFAAAFAFSAIKTRRLLSKHTRETRPQPSEDA